MSKLLNLCFVDDDLIYQYMVKRMISNHPIIDKVWFFADGEEALHFLTEHAADPAQLPDVIFLDINMPIVDGWEFMNQFRVLQKEISKKVLIYMVSSSTDADDIQKAAEIEEISAYLLKPLHAIQLKALLDTIAG